MGKPWISAPRRFPGRSIYLGGLGGRTFFHFVIETLPQLALVSEELRTAERLIVQGYIEPAKEAWLRRAGVTLPIVWLQPLDHFVCDELVFTSRVVEHFHPNPWSVAMLRRLVRADVPASPGRRFLWASRLGGGVRATPWELRLIETLPVPWESVDFARLPPDEAIALCQDCAAFAGLHGAAFANLAFCPPGTRVLEFYQEPKEPWFPALSTVCGHRHTVAMSTIGPAAIQAQLAAVSSAAAAA